MTEQNRVADPERTDAAHGPIRVGLPAIVTYVVLAWGLAWLVALPLWLGDGLREPYAGLLLIVMMYAPAAAALIVMVVLRPVPRGQRLRFLGMWPLRPARRVVWMCVIGLFGTIAAVVIALLVAVAFGWLPTDFAGLSGYTRLMRAQVPAGTPLPPAWVGLVVQLVEIPFAAATVNAVATFGEELGWRGFLVPALRRYGTWPALVISGAVWGLWHAPIILLGYDFDRTDIVCVLLMIGSCIAWGVLFGWLRLRTGSVWPSVFAHAAMNAAGGLPILFVAAGATVDPALALPLGVVSGWIACAIIVVILWLTGQFRRQPALAAPRRRAPRHRG